MVAIEKVRIQYGVHEIAIPDYDLTAAEIYTACRDVLNLGANGAIYPAVTVADPPAAVTLRAALRLWGGWRVSPAGCAVVGAVEARGLVDVVGGVVHFAPSNANQYFTAAAISLTVSWLFCSISMAASRRTCKWY